jgi:arylsulfatase A-like enzyme
MRGRSAGVARAWLCAGVAIGALAACGNEPPWRPPDIVLISVDTLRADHLPSYGHDRPTAPRIGRLAERSALFEHAYTLAPHTLPSHTSLLTGVYPERHRVMDRGDALAPGVATLAEILARHGYATGAVVNAFFLDPQFGLSRGFGVYDSLDQEGPGARRDAETTTQRALAWVDAQGEGPFFLFAHYFDVHSDWERLPYDAPAAYRERFAREGPEDFRFGEGGVFASRYLALMNRDGADYDDEELARVRDLYDAGIAYTDEHVGRLLDGLAARGRLRHAIVILTSDHGEEFQDHGRLLHTQVYEEGVHVPLLVSFPAMRGEPSTRTCRYDGARSPVRPAGRSATLVQLVDVLPTLLECLGAPVPPGVQGRSFLADLAEAGTGRDAVYFVAGGYRQNAVLQDGWKLIEWPERGVRRLYHLPSDPGEHEDLAARHPERVAALMTLLDAHRRESAAVAPTPPPRHELPDEVHDELDALGYVREGEATPGALSARRPGTGSRSD